MSLTLPGLGTDRGPGNGWGKREHCGSQQSRRASRKRGRLCCDKEGWGGYFRGNSLPALHPLIKAQLVYSGKLFFHFSHVGGEIGGALSCGQAVPFLPAHLQCAPLCLRLGGCSVPSWPLPTALLHSSPIPPLPDLPFKLLALQKCHVLSCFSTFEQVVPSAWTSLFTSFSR